MWALASGRNLRDPDARPVVSLNGAHHGGELLSVEVVLDAIELLLTASAPRAGPPIRCWRGGSGASSTSL